MSMQSSNVVALNPFRQWSMHGYKELIPIIPPAAELSENSYIRKNKSQGKAPGIRYPSGQWGGLPGWREIAASESDIDDWHAMGAGVGLRRGAAFMLDIDATDEAVADSIEAAAIATLGEAPMRVGRWPKRALLYRADGRPIDGGKLIFEGPDGAPNQIELPAQMVVYGIHPVTGKPYEWRRKPVAFAELTPVNQEKLDAFLEAQRRLLPKAKRETGAAASDRAAIDQGTLTGRPEHVKAAIATLPNTRDAFPTYDSMILIGNALHASLPDDLGLANELWHEWCARWEGGDYSAELTEKRWDTLQAPHTVGANYIYSKATEHGGFDMAPVWHEEIPVSADGLFPPTEPAARLFKLTAFNDAAATALDTAAAPLIKGVLDQGAMTVLYGESNAGKTFVAMDIGYHIATGRSWAGRRTVALPVLYVAAEGGQGARKRAAALAARYGATKGFYFLLHPINLLRADADLKPLISTISNMEKFGLVVIDTLSRAMAGGDENASTDMGAMVKHLDQLRHASGAHLMVVHHSGKDRAKGARGHSLLRAATDTEIEVADREIAVTKQRDLDGSFSSAFGLDVVTLGVDADGDPVTSCVVRLLDGESVEIGVPSAKEGEVMAAVSELEAFNAEGVSVEELGIFFADKGDKLSANSLRMMLKKLVAKNLVTKAGRNKWRVCRIKKVVQGHLDHLDHLMSDKSEVVQAGPKVVDGVFE